MAPPVPPRSQTPPLPPLPSDSNWGHKVLASYSKPAPAVDAAAAATLGSSWESVFSVTPPSSPTFLALGAGEYLDVSGLTAGPFRPEAFHPNRDLSLTSSVFPDWEDAPGSGLGGSLPNFSKAAQGLSSASLTAAYSLPAGLGGGGAGLDSPLLSDSRDNVPGTEPLQAAVPPYFVRSEFLDLDDTPNQIFGRPAAVDGGGKHAVSDGWSLTGKLPWVAGGVAIAAALGVGAGVGVAAGTGAFEGSVTSAPPVEESIETDSNASAWHGSAGDSSMSGSLPADAASWIGF